MNTHDGKYLSSNHQDDYQFESTPLLRFNLLNWFKQFTATPITLNLTQIVKDLACHVGLSRKQHVRLNQLAWGLQNSLKTSSKPLNEESLIAVLVGDSNAEETLSKRFGFRSNGLQESRSKLLIALRAWFETLSIAQQQRVVSLQQRAFRLSMG